MAVKRYDGSAWQTVAGLGAQGAAATSSSIATWVKTASGGETSLSGNDDNSQSLSYTVGQELVFINGTLLKRGSDYTATNGTSITGLTALAANDVATVWTVNAFSVTGAIANTIVDAKGDLLVGTAADTPGRLAVGTNGQVLTAASTTGTGLTWATPAAGSFTELASGSLPTNANNFTISSISGAYTDLRIELVGARVTTDDNIYLRLNGNSGSVYFATDFEGSGVSDSTAGTICRLQGSTDSATGNGFTYAIILDYTGSHWKIIRSAFMVPNSATPANARGQSYLNGSTITDAITSINFYTESTNNFSAGTYKLYGVK